MSASYDAILIVSFGGPEGMDDVMPFLENVTRGRNVPRERLMVVAHHYELFGGVSPINGQNRQIIASLQELLAEQGPKLPIYWGNRNWQPYLADTLEQMKADGVKNAIAFATAAYSSYSSCKQYIEDIQRAQAKVGDGAPHIDKIRPFFNHPLFIGANIDHLRAAIELVPAEHLTDVHVAFTAHSIPISMATGCQYANQLNEAAGLVAESCEMRNWKLVFQSRSGPPSVPWLEPDILDHIKEIHSQGVRHLIIHPIGFVSDHMEVIYDLDVEAADLCKELGITMHRVPSAGTSPKFIQMIRELILERTDAKSERPYLGTMGANPDTCPPECCPLGMGRPAVSSAAQEQKQ
ncbi:MAG: ferrochelatase [Candidatus Obscuribacterales bacterium]|nr:ferrochelatase [Candidatus Obscuribacterales bacterium]